MCSFSHFPYPLVRFRSARYQNILSSCLRNLNVATRFKTRCQVRLLHAVACSINACLGSHHTCRDEKVCENLFKTCNNRTNCFSENICKEGFMALNGIFSTIENNLESGERKLFYSALFSQPIKVLIEQVMFLSSQHVCSKILPFVIGSTVLSRNLIFKT